MPKQKTHFEQVPVHAVLQLVDLDGPDLSYPKWQAPLQKAQLETEPQKIQEQVFQAEAAIFRRLQELALSADGHHESQAISRATNELLRIKTEKLKWPLP
jgi:hypothetical protein